LRTSELIDLIRKLGADLELSDEVIKKAVMGVWVAAVCRPVISSPSEDSKLVIRTLHRAQVSVRLQERDAYMMRTFGTTDYMSTEDQIRFIIRNR